MNQQTFSSQAGFEKYGGKSRCEMFLDEMELVVPWAELQTLIEPHYAKAGNGGGPVGLSILLRIYFLQQRFNRIDPGGRRRRCTSLPCCVGLVAWTLAARQLRRR
jgi:IS5 family transposase